MLPVENGRIGSVRSVSSYDERTDSGSDFRPFYSVKVDFNCKVNEKSKT